MNNTEVLVIGAGAAGIIAARNLAKAGKTVMLLEARDRIGGRIHTLKYGSELQPAEMGAEFVHGDLPLTKCLLDEAGIAYHSASAAMWKYRNGNFTDDEYFIENWDELLDKLKALKEDITIENFLQQYFSGDEYADVRRSVESFVSGYDNADPARASAFALRREWLSEDEGAQYRVKGGYSKLMDHLAAEFGQAGGHIYLNAAAKKVKWQAGNVSVITNAGVTYTASQLLIAMPLGVLQANAHETGAISFEPAIKQQTEAINSLGFGAVIKILFEFDEPFWEFEQSGLAPGKDLKNMGYLFSEEEIPTWWTQVPQRSKLLTGWLGGPEAAQKIDATNEKIMQQGITSLSHIFKFDPDDLKTKLLSWHVINWTADPFARGSYAYDTVAAPQARQLLNEAIQDTIYFAGEYLYDGTAMGTVEAALTSGTKAAQKILGN